MIVLWACWLGRAYLDFNPYTWPAGGEWGTQLQTHHLWTELTRCGSCAMWNGGINGGAPALGDLFGSMLHPYVAVTTLLWGVVAGAKVAVVLALVTAGGAQWWMARVMRLGTAARLWSALLCVAGGHLAGRMQNGNFGLILSTAACSLALAAAFALGITRERRAALALAVAGALALVAGQAYLQLALLAWSPALLWLIVDARGRLSRVWREYLLAGGLALLLAAVLLVPLLHFWPNVAKAADPTFEAAQPLYVVPLNLFIPPDRLLPALTVGEPQYPYLYNLYIGWLPVLLALGALATVRGYTQRQLLFLGSGVALLFLLASAIPLRSLGTRLPIVTNARHIPLVAGLAVPAVLALAAYGLDRLAAHRWLQFKLAHHPRRRWWHRLVRPRLLLWLLLLWSLAGPAAGSGAALTTVDMRSLYPAIAGLHTPDLQWVAPPFGELRWTEAGLAMGLKLSPIVWVFTWQSSAMPHLEVLRPGAAPALLRDGPLAGLPGLTRRDVGALAGAAGEPAGTFDDSPVLRYPEQQYAAVTTSMGLSACKASGGAGTIAVTCMNDLPGDLTVAEHTWSGWTVTSDGNKVALEAGPWLRVPAAAGPHRYLFRYRPWDVPVGLFLSVVGVLLTAWLWTRASPAQRR